MTRAGGGETDVVTLRTDADVVRARHRVRDAAVSLGLDLVTQTKIITAASELARNTVLHGQGGELAVEVVHDDTGPRSRAGLRLVFTDTGPGIADVDKAMTGGWSSGPGLGLGLPGSRRLVNEFDLQTTPGAGTTVTVVMWRR